MIGLVASGTVSTRAIRTSHENHTACDVCGRTLLRGERAEAYLAGGVRHAVCDLCATRALQEGWVREGTVPTFHGGHEGLERRRRSLLSRLRVRREGGGDVGAASAPEANHEEAGWPELSGRRGFGREPRHVRAVPTSPQHKVASAIDLFNASEHPRTVAGVGRSLGTPTVSVRPSAERPSLVSVVVSWELCWYRYDVDLSDDESSVRVGNQGYELNELRPDEREPNAVADQDGALTLA